MKRKHIPLLLAAVAAVLVAPAAGQVAPTVSMNAPARAGAGISYPVSATVNGDSTYTVDFYEGAAGTDCSGGGSTFATGESAPYSVNWQANTAGQRVLKAVATDSADASLLGCGVTTVAVTDPPVVTLSVPGGTLSSKNTYTLSATVQAGASPFSVSFYDAPCGSGTGANLIDVDSNDPYRAFNWQPPNVDGARTLSAEVTDDLGRTDCDAASVTIDAGAPSAPNLSLSTSSPFAEVAGLTVHVNLAGTGSYRVSAQTDADVVRVNFPGNIDTAAPFAQTYQLDDLSEGAKSVTAEDSSGNESPPAQFNVVFDTAGPEGGGISYLDGNDDDGTIDVTFDPGSDPAGLRPGSGVLERQVVPLRNKGTVCDPFPTGWDTVTTSLTAQTVTESIGANTCARYRYRVTDNVSHETIYASQSIARFFPQDTTAPGNVRRARMRTGDHRAVLTYRLPGAADFKQIRIYRWIAGRRLETEVRVFAGNRVKFRQYGLFNRTRYVYRIVSFDRTLNPSSGVILSGRPQSPLLKSPRDGGTLRRPPTLDWRRHSQASRYNVKLVRNGRTILSRFPRATELKIRGKWKYGGRTQKLRDGTYYWYVYPRIGTRYGTVRWSRFTKE